MYMYFTVAHQPKQAELPNMLGEACIVPLLQLADCWRTQLEAELRKWGTNLQPHSSRQGGGGAAVAAVAV